ncbi:IS5 family transposase [Streptomyces sp. NPDC002785]|uniref:IS5 family transposase n=1 Tax=Streptomyces sp. NPDC002785 TaxID=3154543 RepID=UPI00333332AD
MHPSGISKCPLGEGAEHVGALTVLLTHFEVRLAAGVAIAHLRPPIAAPQSDAPLQPPSGLQPKSVLLPPHSSRTTPICAAAPRARVGRSRGGLTTKIHLAADGNCRPLAFFLTTGQAGDAPAFTEVMTRLRVPRRRGRPRTRPSVVLADKAYYSRAIREHLRQRGIRAVIPSQQTSEAIAYAEAARVQTTPAFDRETYRQRKTVERCINHLKRWRGLATRYEKTAIVYLAGLHVAGIFLWSAR